METVLLHLVKSTALLVIFLVSYMIFLRRETFYASNRFYLVTGIVLSILLPFFQLTKTVQIASQPLEYGNFSIIESSTSSEVTQFDWTLLLAVVYFLGLIYFTYRFVNQLRSIKTLKLDSNIIVEDDIEHVHSKRQLAPFSFFKSIFYCPSQFEQDELNAIITHEKVHARQHHSVDVLFVQIICLLFWFNPLIWIYKSYIKQNLEFLADSIAMKQVSNKKQYQYLMLNQAVGANKLSITNPFYNSLIKKRIVMLHQNQSKKMNTLKLLFVVPVLAVFMMAFNTKTEYVTSAPSSIENVSKDKRIDYIITKSTTNKELEQIKSDLTRENIDFSYTTVRAHNAEIIDIEINLRGTGEENVDFAMNYKSNTSSPIEEIVLSNKGSAFFIVSKLEKNVATDKGSQKTNYQKNSEKDIENVQITNVTIEVDKDSKDENLRKDSEFLAQRGVDITFKGIKRNSAGEITAIKVDYDNGSGDKGNYEQKETTPISPFKISVNFSEDGLATIDILGKEEKNIFVFEALDEIGEHEDIIIKKGSSKSHVWVSSGDEDQKEVIIRKEDGKNKIFINGEEVDEDELHEHNATVFIHDEEGESDGNFSFHISSEDEGTSEKRIKVVKRKAKKGKSKDVFIIKDSDDDADIEVISEEDNGFFFVDNDGDGDPLYIVDGKEVSKKDARKLLKKQKDIATIDVRKGEAATKKYGEKAKNGVVEIITKKN